MKTFIILCLVTLCTMSCYSQIENGPKFNLNDHPEESIAYQSTKNVIIVIGRKSKDCSGFGLCQFTITIDWADIFQIFKASKNPNGTLVINFDKKVYDKQRSKLPNDHFVLEEDFVIEDKTTEALGLKKGYKIKKGKYPIVLDAATGTYSCSF